MATLATKELTMVTLEIAQCILCQREGADWLVRLPLADRLLHKHCADRWYQGEQHIWPGPELCQQWFQEKMSLLRILWMISIPPAPVLKIGTELLPPGFWPRGQNGASTSPRGCKAPSEDPSRFAFFRTRAVLECEVEGTLPGIRKLSYRGFVLRAASGTLILFMDNPLEENAIYVFLLDARGCLDDVRRTKYDLKRKRPASFVCSINHDPKGEWRGRALRLLARM